MNNDLHLTEIFHSLVVPGLAHKDLKMNIITFKYQNGRLYLLQLSVLCVIFLESPSFSHADPETRSCGKCRCWVGAWNASMLVHSGPLYSPQPVLASGQGFVGMLVWVQKKILLLSGLTRRTFPAYTPTPALLFLQLPGAQYLPPPPGAGFLVATGSAICISPAPACPLLIRPLR